MKSIVYYCQGESHKAINKVCQDYARCYIDNEMSIAVVSDGHGGSRYFRSDVGSQTAVDCSIELVKSFVSKVNKEIFVGKPFTSVSALTTERKNSNLRKESTADKQLKQLFASIIYTWRRTVEEHAAKNPFTVDELKLINNPDEPSSIDKIYGCTLLCYVKTPDYWFAFQIGDGKCFSFDEEGIWCEPIPWDECCFLNKTTSICDSSSFEEFRFCYQGDGQDPVSVFLASDGLDDSFGEGVNQANFYIQILKLISDKGVNVAQSELEDTLPKLSKIGSKDDMSLALIYDENRLPSIIPHLIKWQRDNIQREINAVNIKLNVLKNKQVEYVPIHSYTKKELIDAQYVVTEIDRLFEQKRSLAEKYNRFSKELDSQNPSLYTDEIGLYQFKEEENRRILTSEQIKKRLRILNHPIYKFENANEL